MARRLLGLNLFRRGERGAVLDLSPTDASRSADSPLPAWATATSLLNTVQSSLATGSWIADEAPEVPYAPGEAVALPRRRNDSAKER